MICKSTSKNIDLSFYVFPKSEKRKNEWTESVRKVCGKDLVPKLNSYFIRLSNVEEIDFSNQLLF